MRLRRVLWIGSGIVTIIIAVGVTLAIINRDPDANHQAAGASGPCETPVATTGMATYHLIVPTTAFYTVTENIVGVNSRNHVTGKTSAVRGTFLVQAAGKLQVASVQITVALDTLRTDDAQRDNDVHFYLDTTDYPTATFTSTCVSGLPPSYRAGQTITFDLVGNLTMHGETNAERFTMTGRLTGTTIVGTATATIYMTDFGISPPNFVDFDIVANKTVVRLSFTAQAV
jgi:polyisoprenoid-binding protein YceI